MKHSHFPPTFTCDLQPLSTCVSLAYMATRSSAGHGDIPPKLHVFKQNGRQNSRSRDTTVSNKQKYAGTIISSPFWGVSRSACAAENCQGTQKSGSNSSHKTWRRQNCRNTRQETTKNNVKPNCTSLPHYEKYMLYIHAIRVIYLSELPI